MSKYIKLDETINALIELEAKLGSQQQTKRGVRLAIGYVNDMPTIDIVHCKDCKYRKDRVFEVDEKGFCTETCIVFGKLIFNDSEFCNYGRKESGEE